MSTLARKLVVAALVLATVPAAALACDRERDDREAAYTAPDRYAPAVQYAPPVEYAPPTIPPDQYAPPIEYAQPDRYGGPAIPPDQYAPPVRYAPPAPPPAWQDGGRPWRDGAWRWRELAEVRADMRDLDAQRAAFHARFAWSPWKVRRFDRWYAFRRAELQRRYWELRSVAWR